MQVEDRLSIDYQVLQELVTPLRDVENYEGNISSDSDIYRRLGLAWGQLNTSLDDILDIVSKIHAHN